MSQSTSARSKLMVEINRLRSRLAEVEESLGAIQRGEVDALVVAGPDGDQIFTLQGAEHPYRVMVEAINEGAATMLADGTLLYANRQFAQMLGAPLERLIGKPLPEMFPLETRVTVRELILEAKSHPVRCEVQLPQRDGSLISAQLSLNSFNDAGADAICLVATDLSQQKRAELERIMAERALTEEEERNRLVLSYIKDYAIFLIDAAGNVTSWDLGAERVHGFAADQIRGRHFSCLYTPADIEQRKPESDLQAAAVADRVEAEGWRLRQDGSRFWANVILTSLRDDTGDIRGYISVTRDITERKRAEEDLRKLSTRLINSQDQERRRIARELHDSQGQNLSVLLMSLSKLKRGLTQLDVNSQATLSESIEIANQCLREVRTLSYLLHPPLLDEFGLISALHWYVEGFSERSGVAVALHLPPSLRRLPPDMETSLFRLVQESLTNIHRHSGSTTADISLAYIDGQVRLSVRDHGKGISSTGSASGVGIAGMRERVRELGGSLRIDSGQQGTRLDVTLPMPPLTSAAST